MIKKGYSDDGVGGGTKQDVARLMGELYDADKDKQSRQSSRQPSIDEQGDKKESEGKLSTQSSVDTDPDNKDQKTLPEDAATASEANKKKGYSDDGVGGGTKQDVALRC